MFTGEGRGCRNWVVDQVRLFVEAGLIMNREEAERAIGGVDLEFDGGKATGGSIP